MAYGVISLITLYLEYYPHTTQELVDTAIWHEINPHIAEIYKSLFVMNINLAVEKAVKEMESRLRGFFKY